MTHMLGKQVLLPGSTATVSAARSGTMAAGAPSSESLGARNESGFEG